MEARESKSAVTVWARRVVLTILAVALIAVIVVAGFIAYDATFGETSTGVANVTYSGSGEMTLHGYLVEPAAAGPQAAVLLIHEWWGLNEDIVRLADALAAEGYVVLAPDAYRGKVTSQVPRALWLRLTTPQEQIAADLNSALTYLRNLESVDASRVAVWGFCFGGDQALQLALRRPEQVSATIIYYGSLVTEEEALRPLTAAQPVLGIFGAEDAQIPVSEVRAFETALNNLGVENEITVYEGVGHAFLGSENYQEPGPPVEAWQQTIAFLNDNLK